MSQLLNAPKFREQQQVCFAGGQGTILSLQADGIDWLYSVEMPLGAEAEMGRIGYETIILMPETELNSDLALVEN